MLHIVPALPGNLPLDFVAKDFVTVRLSVVLQRLTIGVLNLDPNTAGSRRRVVNHQVVAGKYERFGYELATVKWCLNRYESVDANRVPAQVLTLSCPVAFRGKDR